MQYDNEGFLYPAINTEQCINCELCKKVCPVINQGTERKPLYVYAVKNLNEQIRQESSSGGLFTLFAESVIHDGGIVFGARFNDTWDVIHDFTKTSKGLSSFRGSKYVQSTVGNTYTQVREFLIDGKRVLFSGTPCQIAGLKLFLKPEEYKNLLTIDLVCHGVSSPWVWRAYLDEFIKTVNTHPPPIKK
jgi:coenzyme F420-reducing hydrogenase beta subunit